MAAFNKAGHREAGSLKGVLADGRIAGPAVAIFLSPETVTLQDPTIGGYFAESYPWFPVEGAVWTLLFFVVG